MPLRQPLLHDGYCRRSEERERRNPRDALSPYRDARVLHALQVAAELGSVLGQPLCPTSRTLGLLPQQALRPSSYNLRRQAVLINRFMSKLAVGSRRAQLISRPNDELQLANATGPSIQNAKAYTPPSAPT